MAGLLLIGAAFLWFAACLAIAILLSKLISSGWGRALLVSALVPAFFIAPFSTQIVGWYQFERYCEAADSVSLHGVISAPKEFFSSNGEWRLGEKFDLSRIDENTKLVRLADSFVRWDTGNYVAISNWTPVGRRTTKIYENRSNRLVAEWTSYSYKGGFSGLMGSTTECHPKLMREEGYALYKRLFVYQK
jgi:hypothetical protein